MRSHLVVAVARRAADVDQGLAKIYHQGLLRPLGHQRVAVLLFEAFPVRGLAVAMAAIGPDQGWRRFEALPVPGVDLAERPDEGFLFVMQGHLFRLGVTE